VASRELQLISRIINRGEITKVVDWGVQPEDFRTGVANSMYKYLLAYYSMPDSRGSIIGPAAATQVFPNFALCDDPWMTTEALCHEVRQNRIALECGERMDKIREEMESSPIAACAKLAQLSNEMLQLGSGKATDIMFGSAYDRILHNYEMKKAGVDFSMGPYPWPLLQRSTMGIQPDDYIVFYGRPKSYKSWMLAYVAMTLFMQDKRIILYTKEMTADNIFMRIIACLSQIPYQEFRSASLHHDHYHAIYQTRRMVHMLGGEEKIIVLSGKDAPVGGDTVPWLQSKIKTYQPHACFIDGMYLMSDVKKNKDKHLKVSSISNDLRQMNLETKVPVIATLQANRAAAKNNEANLDELAFSDSIGQDATMIMRVINEKDTPTGMLVLGGAREFSLNGLRINAIPAINFEQYGASDEDARITAKDIDKAKDKDTDADKDGGAHHARARSNGLNHPAQQNGQNGHNGAARHLTPKQELDAMAADLEREYAIAQMQSHFRARGY
jgi:hypothetical protein